MAEKLAFVTGAVCVYLTLKENIWNFPIGLANNLFFLFLFLQGRLWGDASLQILYIGLGLQGWYQWLHGGENKTPLKITNASPRLLCLVGAFVVLSTCGFLLILRVTKDAAPLLDASTTVLSLAAQYLLNRKAIENWVVWLLADLIYVDLYVSRGLELTAVLYGGFGCLCIAGLRVWRRELRNAPAGGAILA